MVAVVEFLNQIILIVASFHHFGQDFVQQRETLLQPFRILATKVGGDVPLDLLQQFEGYCFADRSGL